MIKTVAYFILIFGTYFSVFLETASAQAPTYFQTRIDLVANTPGEDSAFEGASGLGYTWCHDPSLSAAQKCKNFSAFTAATRRVEFGYGPDVQADQGLFPEIVYARWRLVWRPQTVDAGVALIAFDDGPANEVGFAHADKNTLVSPHTSDPLTANYSNPRNDAFDVTAYMESLRASADSKNFGLMTHGNGTDGPLIYSSSIQIIWKMP